MRVGDKLILRKVNPKWRNHYINIIDGRDFYISRYKIPPKELPYGYWYSLDKDRRYIWDHFYTKKELRRLKLESLSGVIKIK